MELEHRFTVAAPVERAWEVLLDLERVVPYPVAFLAGAVVGGGIVALLMR